MLIKINLRVHFMTNNLMQSLSPNLIVKNMKESLDYYKNILKFEVLVTVPEKDEIIWALLQNNNVTIMFQKKESLEKEYNELKNKELGGSFTLFIKVTDLDNFYKKIKDKVKVLKTPNITPYNMKEFAIEDINGYILVFAEEQ